MGEGLYSIGINRERNEMNIYVEGTLTPTEVEGFQKEYQQHLMSINASEFVIMADAKHLHIVSQEMVPMMEACFKLYQSSGFKEVIINVSENRILKMQLSRIARDAKATNITIVNN